MAKILVWNILNFSDNRINNLIDPIYGDLRLDHIIDTLVQNPPDIFAVIEVQTGIGAKVPLPNPPLLPNGMSGEGGCITLLDAMNNSIHLSPKVGGVATQHWKIVPPLVSGQMGYREAVAVYYKYTSVAFIGPNVWTALGPKPNVKGVVGVNYPAPWGLPATLPPVPGAAGKSPSNDTQFAGQNEFRKSAGGAKLYFPFPQNRAPFYTLFQDLKFAGGRNIHLFTMHTTPDGGKFGPAVGGTAATGTANIAKIKEIVSLSPVGGGKLPANDVVVIAGDFNVTQSAKYALSPSSYGKIQALGFNLHFDVTAGAPYDHSITHLKGLQTRGRQRDSNGDEEERVKTPRTKAMPWIKHPDSTVFPLPPGSKNPYYNEYVEYGYLSGAPWDTLDNVMSLYGAAGPPLGLPKPMVVNRIIGAPYILPGTLGDPATLALGAIGPLGPPPVGIAPPTGFKYKHYLSMNIPDIAWGYSAFNLKALGNSGAGIAYFRGNNNYGKIRRTSDHMPVYIEV